MPDPNCYGDNSTIRGIEGGRAAFAFDCIDEVDSANKSNYTSYVKKIPALIKKHGLGQTLGFMFSKEKNGDAYYMLLEHLHQYLICRDLLGSNVDGHDDFIKTVVRMEQHEYLRATKETLNLFNWLRRFAEGKLGDD